jgi:hypothetical protein
VASKSDILSLIVQLVVIGNALRIALFDYFEIFYNGQRRHSSLAYPSAVAFERQ